MPSENLPLADLLIHLEKLATTSLKLWKTPPNAQISLLNVSENVTYLVTAENGYKAILRVHRKNYHNRRAIECELAWLDALAKDNVIKVPKYFRGKNGNAVQQAQVSGLDLPRFMVLFEFLDGIAPSEIGSLNDAFKELGTLAAKCHLHATQWSKPAHFERLIWDVEAVFGDNPTWGCWRDAPEVTAKIKETLEQVENCIKIRLSIYGKSEERFNLIHADMRLANLLVDQNGTRVIDFDDCGFGWFMYDFAAAISFIENDPRIPGFKRAWLEGYQKVRTLSAEDIDEINTFIIFRRMALLAWIGSHIEAPEPKALAKGFAATTAKLGAAWLKEMANQR